MQPVPMSVNMAEGTVDTYRIFKYVAIWSAILLTSILFVHNVATVYAGNVEEFQFRLIHFFIFIIRRNTFSYSRLFFGK